MVALKAVDLFAGCGGLSCGLERAGIPVVGAFENWDAAADVYEMNFAHPVHRMDLSEADAAVRAIRPLAPDLIVGGPPCQDFSHAGKRVEAERASLTEAFAEIVGCVRPAYFIMENVDRAQKSGAYALARKAYKDAGYGLTERVLLASRCGVPQRRKRFFCIGVLGGEDGAVDSYLMKSMSDKEMTLRDYFGDSLDIEYYYRHPRNYNRRGVFSIDEPAPTMRGVNRPVPKGYPGHPGDACEVTSDLRPLTTLERSLVQTFPADFKWAGSKTDREQMVGNAVPVNLGAFVARALLDYIAEEVSVMSSSGSGEDGNSGEQGPFAPRSPEFVPPEKLEAFRTWLESERGMKPRSARDASSRLLRADGILPLNSESEPDRYLFELGRRETFAALSSSVKSQMKRAVTLYCDYLKSNRAVTRHSE